jgi:arginine-tRNA-protein transferase
MILDLIDYAQERGMPWLYLGYYVPGSQKMMYKARFQPAEVYIDGRWRPYEGAE